MLRIEDVHTYYGDSHILQGISLEVKEGEVVALLGRNGAGKTTTFRTIMQLVPPKSGAIFFQDTKINGLKPHEVTRLGIGFVPEDRRIFPTLTVIENLEVAEGFNAKREGRWTIERIFEYFPLLYKLRKRAGGNLSGGEQQLLAIARTLMGNPLILLLDEPCEGLAPIIVESLEKLIMELKGEVTILLAEQNAPFALKVSERGYILEKGQIKYHATTSDLKSNKEIQERYLSV